MPDNKEQHQCLVCGVSSENRVLLACEVEGKENWVCVRCLPQLIHGSH